MAYTLELLGQSVKVKYPGAYDHISNEELGRAFVEKYPEYQKVVSDYTPASQDQQQAEPEKKDGFFKSVAKGIAKPFVRAGVSVVEGGKAVGNVTQALADKALGDQENYQRNLDEAAYNVRPGERDVAFFGKTKPIRLADPNESAGDAVRSFVDTAGVGAEAASNFIGGGEAVGAGKSLLKGALKETIKAGVKGGAVAGALAGAGNEMQQEDASVKSVIKETAKGAVGGAAVGGVLAGVPAVGIQGYRIARGTAKEVKNFIAPEVEVALTKAIKPTARNTEWNKALKTAVPDIFETAKLTNKSIKNLDELAVVINDSKKRIWSNYQELLGPNANATIDGNDIADAMVAGIDKRFASQNPIKVQKIQAVADTYRRPITLNEAEEFLQSANNDLYSYYAKNKVGRRVALGDPDTAYVVREADSLRDTLYSRLSELTGTDAALLKRKYGALTNIENEVLRRRNIAARQNPNSLAEQVTFASAVGDAIDRSDTLFGVAKGVGKVATARYLKAKNTSDELVRGAFEKLGKQKR